MFDKLDWYLRREPWRNDPATAEQFAMLESLGCNERPATKGGASDAISLRVPPSDDELRFLRQEGIDPSLMSQHEAMDAIARIISDEKRRAAWMESAPLLKRDVKRGDRVLLLNEDNTTWLGEISAASGNPFKVRPIGHDGSLGAAISVHASQLLSREGRKPIKHAGNLIPGDLIYTSEHRSGLQYGKVVRGSRHSRITCLRWVEAKSEWTKTASELHVWSDVEVLGHETDAVALRAFFDRIEKDRTMWQASSGRSGWFSVPGEPGVKAWQQKERVWSGDKDEPVRQGSPYTTHFRSPEPPPERKPSLLSRLLRMFTQ